MKKQLGIGLGIIVLILFVINYSEIDNYLENYILNSERACVVRVIDGDTIVVTNFMGGQEKETVRLLGINTPEKGEKYYNEAKEFLENKIFNKTIILEFGKERTDKYGRLLAYVYFENQNINEGLIEKGFANPYFPSGKDNYYDEFFQDWGRCVQELKENLCKSSEDICRNCIILKKFDYENEIIVFENLCKFNCDLSNWKIKDEGRKVFIFEDFVLEKQSEVRVISSQGESTKEKLFWSGEDYIWTDSGDTLFLRDSKEGLVLWKNY